MEERGQFGSSRRMPHTFFPVMTRTNVENPSLSIWRNEMLLAVPANPQRICAVGYGLVKLPQYGFPRR